jgi:HK97 family phage prohead protease
VDEYGAVRIAGHVTNPGGTERLHEYWVHGPGAAKIRWGEPNDFDRCVMHLSKYIADAKGYCNLAHHAALGIYPATHAAMEKKMTGRSDVTTTMRAELATASINDLPDSDFAYIEPGGKKDASGKTIPRSLRHFPVHDVAHVRNALSRAPQSPFGDKAMPKIKAAAKRLGVDVSSDSDDSSSSSGASRAVQDIRRDCQLEDIHILRTGEGDSTGRVVEAYAAVFGQPAIIRDHQGHYEEEIDRGAFDDRLTQISRSRRGVAAALRVLYNHGRTAEGIPAPEFQKPLGRPVEVRAESRGLLTRTEYARTPLAEEVLELIRAGAVTAQSFVGGIIRSDPELRGPGDKYRARNGQLTRVRRLALGLREYGPVLWEAYSGAEILGVRMALPGAPDLDFDPPVDEEYVPDMAGDGTGSAPEDATSARYHQHALYRMLSEEKRAAVGLTF